jgi:hypothetical protein
MEALLGPSLCESMSDDDMAPPAHVEAPLEPGQCWYFSYGASMAFSTLSRQGVRPLSRDAAMVADTSVRIRFRHRGGERVAGRRGGRTGRMHRRALQPPPRGWAARS